MIKEKDQVRSQKPSLFQYWYYLLMGVIMLVTLLTGCHLHRERSDIRPLVDAYNTYSLSSGGIELQSKWWEALNDRTLDALIEEALSENLTLKQAHARIEQALAADTQAVSFQYPELSGRASAEEEWIGNDKPEDTARAGFVLSWELDLWGRLASARQAARYELLASRDEMEAAALLLTAQVAETYFQVMEQNLQLALLNQQISAGETLLELIELRFSYGEASIVDVFQQRQQLASTRGQVPLVRSRLRTLENRLSIQLGRAPSGRPLSPEARFPELPGLPSAGVPVHLLKTRPDLRRIFKQLAAIDYRVAEAVADRFPRIELTGNTGVADSFSADGRLISLLLEAVAPVLDWDRRNAEVRKREARFREELARYSEAYLTAVQEVENALWQEHHQKELLKALEEQVSIARANLDQTRNRYRQGLTDYLPVLTALQSLQQLERDILSEERQLISTRILLYRALGGTRLTPAGADADRSAINTETKLTGEVLQ